MSAQLDNWVSNPDETHGPLMATACWSLCWIAFCFLSLRLYVRYGKRKLWIDDLVLVTSWIFLLAQVVLNQSSVNLGLGKHALDIDPAHLETITYHGAAGLSISIVAINLSKISFAVTLLRLTDGWLHKYCYFAMATLAAFAIPIAILPWVQCKPLVKTFIDFYPGECIDKAHSIRFGEFQAVWAALMDISLAIIPWKILWNLQMQLAEKSGIAIAMSLGILAGATALVRARYIQQLAYQDISYDATASMIWSAAETAVCIVAISIPVLRAFIKTKVDSAVEYYRNTSNRSGNDMIQQASHVQSHPAAAEGIRMSTKVARKGSLSDPLATHRSSKTWLSLDDEEEDGDQPEHPEAEQSKGPMRLGTVVECRGPEQV